MAGLRERLEAADGPQPDILAKKTQSDQFKVSSIQDVFCASNCVTFGNVNHLFSIQGLDYLHLH